MTDDPTTKTRPSTPQESSTKSAPSSSIKIGDPKHDDIGDKDAGEGHKGPRVDATRTAPDKHVQGEHPKSSGQQSQQPKQSQQSQQPKQGEQSQQPKQGQQSQQPKQGQQSQTSQKPAPMKSGESSGSECCGSSAESQTKPGGSSSKK
jgi:hypothetical protein